MSDEPSLFSRWSKRKRAAEAEAESPSEAAAAEAAAEPAPPPTAPEESEEEVLARLGLPRPEDLKAGDDFSVFMKAGVPEFLRRRALRRLWKSNPVLANLDGLNDYDDDFTAQPGAASIVKTAYRVGRGFLAETDEPKAAPETGSTPEAGRTESVEPRAEAQVVEEQGAEAPRPVAGTPAGDAEDSQAPRPRRMRFQT